MPHCCKLSALKQHCSCQEKLADDFIPGPLDVICSRGKAAKSHPGNIRYRRVVEGYMERYVKAATKLQKMAIISEIVTKVRMSSPEGGFVKQKHDGFWYEVGDHFAREKVSQSLRDSLHIFYRSSCKSKTMRRAIRRKQATDSNSPESMGSAVMQKYGQPPPLYSSTASAGGNMLSGNSTLPTFSVLLGAGNPSVNLPSPPSRPNVAPPTSFLSTLQSRLYSISRTSQARSRAGSVPFGPPSISPLETTEADIMVAMILLSQAHQNSGRA